MKRIQLFTSAAALAVMCTAGSAGIRAQTPAQPPKPNQPATTRSQPPSPQPPGDDATFAQKAAEAGMMEVMHAKMAAQKASNARVKAYANKLVRDHTAANNQLKAIAKKKDITLPDMTHMAGQCCSDQSAHHEPWMSQTGAAFDKGFIDAQVKAHQEAVDLFDKQASSGSDAQLKAFAARQLPGLRAHLKQAQDLQSKLATTTH